MGSSQAIHKVLEYAHLSDMGKVRNENQDSLGKFPSNNNDLALPKGQLFVIADGMGGHVGGQEASSLAVKTIGEIYFSTEGSILDSLRVAFKHANEAICDFAVNDPRLQGMGTTCIALVLQGNLAYVAHIGDSRLYRITSNEIEQVTTDHSKVAEMVRRGMISASAARNHPERSVLYRAMGVRSHFEFDTLSGIKVGSDQYFLLCTDGLTEYVEPQEMQTIVLSHPPSISCEMLVELANTRGGRDNITLQIIYVHAV